MSCCAVQVACGGYHTLAVVKHDLREAEVDAGRRGLRQWAKPRMSLTVEIPTDGDTIHQSGPLSAIGPLSAAGPQLSSRDPMLAAQGPGKGIWQNHSTVFTIHMAKACCAPCLHGAD